MWYMLYENLQDEPKVVQKISNMLRENNNSKEEFLKIYAKIQRKSWIVCEWF